MSCFFLMQLEIPLYFMHCSLFWLLSHSNERLDYDDELVSASNEQRRIR